MDKEKDLPHIFFSGVESQQAWDNAMDAGAKHVLMSIHYLNKKSTQLRKRLDKHPDVKILIDSGAYTFISNINEYRDKPISFWEKYIEDYIKWAREHKDIIFAIVELDIDDIVGTPKVEEWREKYWEPLEKEGIKVCYVWHEIKGIKEWARMCKKYDYVGMSFASDSVSENTARKMMRTAEKYGAKVHGFATTSVDLLIKLPLYTMDSTTWLVGKQYGELNWFDGRQMKRLKKEQWKKQKSKFIKLGIDWEKLKAEDPREMDIVNVKAFLKAEEYIHKRLKSRMYWLKKKKVKDEVEKKEPIKLIKQEIDDIEFPDLDEWDRKTDLEEYATRLNINPKYSDETTVANAVCDATTFLNADYYKKRIEEVYDDEVIGEITRQYLEENISDRDEGIRRLIKFFEEVATGNNDFFYTHSYEPDRDEGESEDEELDDELEAPPRPKERDEYLVDDEMEDDLSMPEVEALDQELMVVEEAEDKPVERNPDGTFLPGHKVRKPKNLYSDKFPKLACDTCYAAQNCPEFKPGYLCAYNKIFKKFDSRDPHDVMEQMVSIINMNSERIQRVAIFEMLDGGMPDANLTQLMQTQMNWLDMLMDLRKYAFTRESGRESVQINMQGEGILSKIFGVSDPPKHVNEDMVVDGEYKEVDEDTDL